MNYLNSLDAEQREAVLHPATPLTIHAGAGSGKTKLITARIAHQIESGADPSKLFITAFTRAAAKEMRERIVGVLEEIESVSSEDINGLDVSTFHSLMFRFLNEYMESRGQEPWGLMKEGRKKILFQKLLAKPSRDYSQAVNLDADIANVIGQISRWKNAIILSTDEEIQKTLDEAPKDSDIYAAARVYPLYEQILKDEHLIDFDDMLLKSLRLLLTDDNALSAARGKWNQGFFVDEAQDTNPAQWAILNLLAPPEEDPNVTVVGDLRQCLYAWRGASPEVFEQFVDLYKSAKTVDLVNNYRCSEVITDVSNSLASGLGMKDQRSARQGGNKVEVNGFVDPVAQAKFIANDVQEARENGELGGSYAVLVRTNAQSAPIESAFVSLGLPYWCNGGGFFDRMEVGDIMAYLRVANDSSRTDLLERIINRPTRYLGKAFVQAVSENMDKYDGDIIKAIRLTNSYSGRKLSPKQRKSAVALSELLYKLRETDLNLSPLMAINTVLGTTEYIDWLKSTSGMSEDMDSQRIDNIEALKMEAEKFVSIKSLLDFADESSRLQVESSDSTSILTVHRAKGLEWPTVWVTNMHDDSIPHIMAKREGDIVSEKRVAYVAFTRAEDNLKIGVPRSDEKGRQVVPSPFLELAGLTIDESPDMVDV